MKSLTPSFICSLLASSALLISSNVSAKMISLYEQPNDNAKQVGTVDIAKGVVPIFSQADGKWIKVGDPQNGNVGWMKASDMSGEPNSAVTFTQRFIDNGKGPQTYQFIQYGPQSSMSTAEQQKLLQQMQLQQQELQKAAQQMFSNYHQWEIMANPMLIPVVYVPVPNQPVIVKPVTRQPTAVKSQPGSVAPNASQKAPGALRTSPGIVKTNQ